MPKIVYYDSSDDENEPQTIDREKIMAQRRHLPVYRGRNHLIPALLSQQVSIVIGETGSGKSTQIPQLILEQDPKARIAVTQPRRVAAISLAGRVAHEMNTKVGKRVGFQVRFQAKYSPKTPLRFLTDGMLMRELMVDPMLAKFNTIIIDEAHERTVVTDLLLGLLKGLIKKGYKGRIIIMSATLDADTFREFFDNAPVYFAPGKAYGVDRFYLSKPADDLESTVLQCVLDINHKEATGDVLVFLPGQEEIENVKERLTALAPTLPRGVPALLPVALYASLDDKQQDQVFWPTPAQHRKIILATNIAETSLTIPGVRYVVDSGLRKSRVYRAKLGFETLLPVAISQASASQRMGRAGREAPGKCFRLYTEDKYRVMDAFTEPEIARIAVTSPVLQLKNLGVDPLEFDWIQAPAKATIKNALLQLYGLGALSPRGEITALGREMVVLPLDPALAAVLVHAKKLDAPVRDAVLEIAACLQVDLVSSPSPNRREEVSLARSEQFPSAYQHGDLILLKLIYDYFKGLDKGEQKAECKRLAVSFKALKKTKLVLKQLLGYLNITDYCADYSEQVDPEQIIRCFLSGYSVNVARRVADRKYKSLSNQSDVLIHPSSSMFGRKAAAIMYVEFVHTTRSYARGVSPVQLEWLGESILYGDK